MSTGIRWQFAHHRRTKRRLNISAFCYPIRSGRLCLACDFRRLGAVLAEATPWDSSAARSGPGGRRFKSCLPDFQ